MKYKERSLVTICGTLIASILLAVATGAFAFFFLLMASLYLDTTGLQAIYGCVVVVILFLYAVWSFCWKTKFARQVQLYLNELNRTQLAPYRI